jgi:acyl carrier protein
MGRQISQRIEVLLKKASVDPTFRTAFLERRGEVAREIGLQLEPDETAMLRAVRREQLEAIIARTSVPEAHRRAFLGQAAAAMLAALGIVAVRPGAAEAQDVRPDFPTNGVRPDIPPSVAPYPVAGGVRPDKLDKKPKTIEQRVIGVIAAELGIDELRITIHNERTRAVSLVDDLEATEAKLVQVRKGLEKEFSLKIPIAAFKKLHTVGETVDYVKKAVDKHASAAKPKPDAPAKAPDQPQPQPEPPVPPIFVGGVRPN